MHFLNFSNEALQPELWGFSYTLIELSTIYIDLGYESILV